MYREEELEVRVENPISEEGIILIQHLSTELGERYGDDGTGEFNPKDTEFPGSAFIVIRLGREPAGCGAIRPLGEEIGEIKKMFVEPNYRGRGIARKILNELESIAIKFGYKQLRLVTGIKQPEAIRLYESAGYFRIPCYGIYINQPMIVCFEKRL